MTPRARSRPFVLAAQLALAALAPLAAGCGGGHDATEKELADLHAELARLRAGEAAIGERLDRLEINHGALGGGGASPRSTPGAPGAPATAASAPRTPDGDRPNLDVVRLGPSEGDGDADPDAARPVLRAVGGDGSVQPGAKKNPPRKGAVPAPTPKKPAADADPSPTAKP
jgi:hypothetical protein